MELQNVMGNVYMDIKSQVKLNGIFSSFFGMQRRCNARRKLFPLFINDLENFLLENYIVGLQSISSEIENNLSINFKL